MDEFRGSTDAVIKLISLMILTRYIDELNGDNLAMYVRSYRPKTLVEAYEITIQHSNDSFRQKMGKTQSKNNNVSGDPQVQIMNQLQVHEDLHMQNDVKITTRNRSATVYYFGVYALHKAHT